MKKRAFTLVELLAIVAILGVLMTITIPNVFNVINQSRNRSFLSLINTFETDANYYASKYRNEADTAITGTGHYDITLQQLADAGLIKTPVNDPRTDAAISLTKKVVITKDAAGAFTSCYEDNNKCSNEVFLAGNFSVASASANDALGTYVSKNNSNYFVGADPNNWIQFGQVSSADATPLLWRIIKSDGEGIKIIYEGVKNGTNAPTDDGRISSSTAWDTSNSNKWERPATLGSALQTWYDNLYVINKATYVSPINWCIGGVGSGINFPTDPVLTSSFVSSECMTGTYNGGTFNGRTTSTSPIGLIRASDYLSTSSAPTCVASYQTSGGTATDCGKLADGTVTNFLYKSNYWWWTANALANEAVSVWSLYADGSLSTHSASLASGSVRPVLNLRPDTFYIGGTGSLADPYRIGISATGADNTPPVITMSGSDYMTVDLGGTYTEPGAAATDNIDGSIAVTSTGAVNPNLAGTYIISYDATDAAGNLASTKTRTINVFEYDYAYDYTGSYQTFTTPYAGNYQIETWGAQGWSANGGKGAYVKGTVNLNKNQNLYVYVGQQSAVQNGTSFNGSTATSNGYPGGGATDIRVNKKYRYVRDYINNNSTNAVDVWTEIQVIDFNGTNVALNKPVTGSMPENPVYPYSRITDGSTDSSVYAAPTTHGLQYIEIDLGQEYNIKDVKIWHYYTDGRTFYGPKTVLYNTNRTESLTIYDSTYNPTYAETSAGKWHKVGFGSRIMVAGGGGASQVGVGVGGILTGGNGQTATGGTQTAGGTQQSTYGNGSFGVGGGGCGGGGGYYGGGGGTCANGGGGGSSFVSNGTSFDAINPLGINTGQPVHYSGYTFSSITTAAGNASMPNPRAAGTITGNTGHGYAKITYIP